MELLTSISELISPDSAGNEKLKAAILDPWRRLFAWTNILQVAGNFAAQTKASLKSTMETPGTYSSRASYPLRQRRRSIACLNLKLDYKLAEDDERAATFALFIHGALAQIRCGTREYHARA